MFVRVNRNKQGREYLQILRSYREKGKVKHEVLFTLGRLDVLQEHDQIDQLIEALSRFATRQRLIDISKDITIDKIYYLGAAHVSKRMLERVGLIKVLEKLEQEHPRLGMQWQELILGMILNRFMEPCSKKQWKEKWLRRVYPDILKAGEPSLSGIYRAMDILYEHKDKIEQAIFERNGERDLFNQEIDIVFYDTTTLYFESTDDKRGDLRRFGYSKEHRNDCVQVVFGLLIDRDGIPVGYELFPGNTYDGKSVPAVLDKLKTKFHVGRIIFVADCGMISKENLKEISEAGMEYIFGMRLAKTDDKSQKEIYDLKRYRMIGRDEKLGIYETTHKGDRLILTWSEERAKRDIKVRKQIIEKIRNMLKERPAPKKFISHRGYRQFLKGLDEGHMELDEKAIAESQKRDGFFGVLTNIKADRMSAGEVYGRYKDLWHIEDAFGEIKGPIKTRPMFHWTDKRIHAHVLICLMAYYIEAIITRILRQKKADFTAEELFRELNEVYAVPVEVRGTVAWVRNEIRDIALRGYQFLSLKPPERVLKIEKVGVVTQK